MSNENKKSTNQNHSNDNSNSQENDTSQADLNRTLTEEKHYSNQVSFRAPIPSRNDESSNEDE